MVFCFAFFDQSIPFPQYYEISTKLDQTGTTAQVAQGRRRWSGRSGYGRTTFLAKMVLAGPCFWLNIFFAGPFSHVSYRPSLMIYFSMIKD